MDRVCTSCGDQLLIGTNWTSSQRDKRTYKCNLCRASHQRSYHNRTKDEKLEKQRARYYKNREVVLEKQRENNIFKSYGISVEEYDNLIKNNNCTLCGQDYDKVLDHCHAGGHIRGVLCRQCNMALGLFKDDTALIERALNYLLSDKEKAGINAK